MKKTSVCPTCGHKIGAADSPPCPKCGSRSVRAGRAKNKSQRYLCSNRNCRYIFGKMLVNTLAPKKKKEEPAPVSPQEEPIPSATGTESPLPSQPPNVDESTPSP